MNLKKLWQLYKKQLWIAKFTALFATTTREERRKRGLRWMRTNKPKRKLTRSQRQRLAALKIEPPEFTGFNPKRTRRYIKGWRCRMQKAIQEKREKGEKR